MWQAMGHLREVVWDFIGEMYLDLTTWYNVAKIWGRLTLEKLLERPSVMT